MEGWLDFGRELEDGGNGRDHRGGYWSRFGRDEFLQGKEDIGQAIDDFFETEQERNRLVKIGTSYFNLASVSHPWQFVFFVIMEYLTLDGRYTKSYGYHFVLSNHF